MLRKWFIGGYATFLIFVITLLAIKVIAVVGPGGLGNLASEWSSILFQSKSIYIWGSIVFIGFIAWLIGLFTIAKNSPEWEKVWVKTLVIGCFFMSGFLLVLLVVGTSAYALDGFAGEVAAKIAGYMSSPVLMELGFLMISIILLMCFNLAKKSVEGDEFVEIEIPDNLFDKNSE